MPCRAKIALRGDLEQFPDVDDERALNGGNIDPLTGSQLDLKPRRIRLEQEQSQDSRVLVCFDVTT